MALDSFGYREGPRMLVSLPVDSSTADITAGDILAWGTAGYDVSILVDVSELSIYEFPPDAGNVTQAIVGTTMDVGGARSANIDASADDVVVCVRVDVDANTGFFMFKTTSKYAGVA